MTPVLFHPTARGHRDLRSQRQPVRLFLFSLGLILFSALVGKGQTISFDSSPKLGASLGVAYAYDANATASDGSEVRYSLRFGPSGMSVDSRTGVVSWQPTGEGDFDAEIRAELANNPSVNATQGWKINALKPLHHPGCTGNEAWLTVGRGLPGAGNEATVMNGKLYMVHKPDFTWDSPYLLSTWNGTYWEELNRSSDSLGQLIAFDGELYSATSFVGITGVPNTIGLAKWDGTSWSGVGPHDFVQVTDMEVLNGELYVLGLHSVSHNPSLSKWDGTNWETIYEGADMHLERGAALATLNNKLYVACSPGSFSMDWDEMPLVELVDGTLQPVENRQLNFSNDYATVDLIPHNGTLVFLTSYRLMQWDGTKTEVIEMPEAKSFGSRSAISYNGDLYVATWQREGALPMVSNYPIWRLDNSEWFPVSAIQGLMVSDIWVAALDFIEYDGDLYSYGSLSQSCNAALNNVAVLGTENECARISGSVYHDDNRTCSVDPNELKLAGEIIEILPGPFYTLTNNDGDFTTLLRPGTYSLSVMPKHNWMKSCPLPIDVTLGSAAAAVSDVNIGTDMIPGIFDVRSSIAIGRPRPGFDFTYTLTYWNSGTEPATGKLIFEHDGRLNYQTSTTSPSRQLGNILEWDFANLPVGASVSITITLGVPSSMALGTQICAFLDVELQKKDDDEFLSDNRDSVCTEVRGSYDPNDIHVAPVRFDEELSDAPLLPGDTVLSYLVRFQNTGNDTAFTVIVSDTLDQNLLDIPSIQLGAASHDFDFDISGPGILTWTFNNIMLPDSGANELASHGYFKYAIRLRRGLAPMTQIPNRAAIYFDYNAPVITNTVVSITSGTLGLYDDATAAGALQIYPNPVLGLSSITLNMTDREHVSLKLIDSRGEVIAVLNDGDLNAGEQSFRLDGRSLAAGAYYLVLNRGGVKELYPVVIGR